MASFWVLDRNSTLLRPVPLLKQLQRIFLWCSRCITWLEYILQWFTTEYFSSSIKDEKWCESPPRWGFATCFAFFSFYIFIPFVIPLETQWFSKFRFWLSHGVQSCPVDHGVDPWVNWRRHWCTVNSLCDILLKNSSEDCFPLLFPMTFVFSRSSFSGASNYAKLITVSFDPELFCIDSIYISFRSSIFESCHKLRWGARAYVIWQIKLRISTAVFLLLQCREKRLYLVFGTFQVQVHWWRCWSTSSFRYFMAGNLCHL